MNILSKSLKYRISCKVLYDSIFESQTLEKKKKKKVFMSDSIKFNNLNCASKFVIQNIQEK